MSGSILDALGSLFSSGGGAMAAPGMTEAGYTLAPGLTQAASDPAMSTGFLGSGISNKDVSSALGKLGQPGGGAASSAAGKGAGPTMPSLGAGAGAGRPTAASLTPLLQLLAQRREALLNSATGGAGMGQSQPQGVGRVQGLLGF